MAELPEVEAAAKEAQLHGEILNFPQQYKTIVGERGITLSGGQRQRSALGRALLVEAPILVLDDALSSVDNQTATQILANLSSEAQQKTVIFVSHQMSAAAACDRILVMDQGQIVPVRHSRRTRHPDRPLSKSVEPTQAQRSFAIKLPHVDFCWRLYDSWEVLA